MSRVIACDTGPLIHLSEANAIYLLKLAGGILIPPAVATEFKSNLPSNKLPDWLQIHELSAQSYAQATRWVRNNEADIGESQAIASGVVEDRDQAYRLLNGLKRSYLWISERVLTATSRAIDELTSA